VLVLSAGALACATAMSPPGPGSPLRALVMAVVAAVVVIVALAWQSAPAVRAAVVVSTVFVIFTGGSWLGIGPVVTAVAVGVVPLLVLALLGRRTTWQPALPWLGAGRLDPMVWALAAGTVLVAAVALTLFAVLVRPEVSPYLAMLRSTPVWLAVLGVIGFAVVNPVWEEALYRGVLQYELGQTLGVWPAVVAQAVLFGLSHLYGFPSGWFGVVMAATWGFGLGLVRMRTGGVVVPYLVHAGANVTIGMLAVALLR
jgi:uncharacterized protein